MYVLGIDVGATKIAAAILNGQGEISYSEKKTLKGSTGLSALKLVTDLIQHYFDNIHSHGININAIGICIPGIYNQKTQRIWAPNIPGWDDLAFEEELKKHIGPIPVYIESDRSCYILGEIWKGNAQGCSDAIFMGVGTGIGAGIVSGGRLIRGAGGISGSMGWMALCRPYKNLFERFGCFESMASGDGMARLAVELLKISPDYEGALRHADPKSISAIDVFEAFQSGDLLAIKIKEELIAYWGMGVANLVTLFNPEKILLGGGVFGPAITFIPEIIAEAGKWAQPVAMKQVQIEAASLGGMAGVTGAAWLAFNDQKLPDQSKLSII